MVNPIRWLKDRLAGAFNSPTTGDEITGFVYVEAGETGPMAAAAAGLRIGSLVDGPPWIVVYHCAGSSTSTRWPGRLWKVRVARMATEQPMSYVAYTRATAVDVMEEMPLAALFETNGKEVADFLHSVSQLEMPVVEVLSNAKDEVAAALHNTVWHRWLAKVYPASHHVGENHEGSKAIGALRLRSPVGNAPSILHSELFKRARALVGEVAFEVDEEAVCLNPQWSRVADSLQHALFAIGAGEDVLNPSGRVTLRQAYERAMKLGRA